MSVAVEHRTVNLWPLNASPLNSRPQRPRKAAVVQHADEADPAALALGAIMSSYRHGRAGIISGDSSATARRLDEESPADLAPPLYPPTVPIAYRSDHKAAALPQRLAPGQDREVDTLWSRLVRSRRPAPRGRHSPKC